MTTSRWIEIDTALLKTVSVGGLSAKALWKRIMQQPSINIVRCSECKYAEVSVSPITGLWCTRFGINDMAMADDDFCSYGERREP